jgi:hypothetical protein
MWSGKRAVAITDKRHPNYSVITNKWLSSNPRGFARWFEERTRGYAMQRLRKLVEARLFSSVDDVPTYDWKTPLQRSIQLLKRHRDVMFQENPGLAPISMIITNLATHAYGGELDVFAAVTGIVDRMPSYINPTRPRIPNPANPAEDCADKWSRDPKLEENFYVWHAQAKADLARLPELLRGDRLAASIRNVFRVNLSQDQIRELQPGSFGIRTAISAAPTIAIGSAPRPWGN